MDLAHLVGRWEPGQLAVMADLSFLCSETVIEHVLFDERLQLATGWFVRLREATGWFGVSLESCGG